MRILIDAMGGDYAPKAVLEGCIAAREEYGISPVPVGNRQRINECAEKYGLDLSGFEILHAENAVGMQDKPLTVRSRPDTSLRVGLTALAAGEADAFVSAGNTGALQMGGNLFVRRIDGITRSAIGAILPITVPVLLLDSGANATFTPDLLCQYALMGSIYMRKVHALPRPRTGLLNIGEEAHKGTPDHAKAYARLSAFDQISFVGNIEPDALMRGGCDVLVSDGFSGNILLKTMESMSRFVFDCVEESVAFNPEAAKCGHNRSLFLQYQQIKRRFDPTEYGGAPIIGLRAPIIKAHGNSDANAIKNAVKQAMLYTGGKVVEEIARGLAGFSFSERSSSGE